MFLNNLYTVLFLDGNETSVTSEIKINPEHTIYEGHFPGSPVTPGVVQLQIIKEILETYFQSKLKMKQMRTCKFLQIINPLETPVVQIDARFAKSEFLEVTASIRYKDSVYLKAQLSYLFAE